uniref:Uncharacterized protein n=1 Tax=Fundulus heteroclitus TaxID=8078 RepID=A0A3Q2QDT7_FUNHE
MASSRRHFSHIQVDQKISKTRVKTSQSFERWSRLNEAKGLRRDTKAATFLLDRYVKCFLMD